MKYISLIVFGCIAVGCATVKSRYAEYDYKKAVAAYCYASSQGLGREEYNVFYNDFDRIFSVKDLGNGQNLVEKKKGIFVWSKNGTGIAHLLFINDVECFVVPMYNINKTLKVARQFLRETDFEAKLPFKKYKEKISLIYTQNSSAAGCNI